MRAPGRPPGSVPALGRAARSAARLLDLGCGPFARAAWIDCEAVA